MACKFTKRYSVYYGKTEMPLILYANAKECAEAMGITVKSFYRYICFMRQGKIKLRKWQVYEDDLEE